MIGFDSFPQGKKQAMRPRLEAEKIITIFIGQG